MNKQIFAAVVFTCFFFSGYGQSCKVYFTYDKAGNRIKRELNDQCEGSGKAPLPGEKPGINRPKEQENTASLSLNPNPAKNDFKIAVTAPEPFQTGKLSVMDYSGKTLIRKVVYSNEDYVDASVLPNGIYYCRVEFDNQVLIKRFIVIK